MNERLKAEILRLGRNRPEQEARIKTAADLIYEKKIDSLICKAEAYADRVVPVPETKDGRAAPDDVYATRWSRAYHLEMDRLAEQAGLRRKLSGSTEKGAPPNALLN